jgi:N-acetylmuramoyl-L-alanine amidase
MSRIRNKLQKNISESVGRVMRWLQISLVALLSLFVNYQAFGATCVFKAKKDITVILDVGHTASDPGQISARGVPEYDFNMKLAQRVSEELVKVGFLSRRMIVTDLNGHPGLLQRSTRANDLGADLFISFHHNGVRDETLIPWQYQGEEHRFLDKFKGFSLFVSRKNNEYEESLGFARVLADGLMASGLEFTTHHDELTNTNKYGRIAPLVDRDRGIYAYDNFVVLRESNMPAVLLEAGMIVNRAEEQMLSSPAFRAIVAKAVSGAVEGFCYSPSKYKVIDVPLDDVLNLRSGPATHFSIIGKIPPNGRGIQIVGNCENNWCKIDYSGTRGWVNRQFLSGEN